MCRFPASNTDNFTLAGVPLKSYFGFVYISGGKSRVVSFIGDNGAHVTEWADSPTTAFQQFRISIAWSLEDIPGLW